MKDNLFVLLEEGNVEVPCNGGFFAETNEQVESSLYSLLSEVLDTEINNLEIKPSKKEGVSEINYFDGQPYYMIEVRDRSNMNIYSFSIAKTFLHE